MKLNITTNFKEVDRALQTMRADIAEKAMASTVNKVAAQANTQMVRGITAEFNLPAKKVREKLKVRKARVIRGQLLIEAELSSQGPGGRRALNLINFQARQTLKGVSVKIRKAGGRKVIPGAFSGNKGRTVFRRVGKERLPIKALQTIDVPQMFNTKRINTKVVRFIEQKLPEVFLNEAAYFTRKFEGT